MLTGLLISLLAVVALFAIPVALDFRFDWPDDEGNEIILTWALGLVRTRIPIKASERIPATSAKRRDSTQSGSGQPRNVLAAVRQRSFRERVYRFVGDLWRAVIKEDVYVHARIGLDNPADTGKLWAFVGPASAIAKRAKSISIDIAPDFVSETLEIDSRGRLRLVPLQVSIIAIGMLLSPATWQGIRAMRAR